MTSANRKFPFPARRPSASANSLSCSTGRCISVGLCFLCALWLFSVPSVFLFCFSVVCATSTCVSIALLVKAGENHAPFADRRTFDLLGRNLERQCRVRADQIEQVAESRADNRHTHR